MSRGRLANSEQHSCLLVQHVTCVDSWAAHLALVSFILPKCLVDLALDMSVAEGYFAAQA